MFKFNLRDYRQFLTKNERNKVYLRKNSAAGRVIADSKFKTKRRLAEAGVAVPKLIARFRDNEELTAFDWNQVVVNFVIKPVTGYGGDGILIFRKRSILSEFSDKITPVIYSYQFRKIAVFIERAFQQKIEYKKQFLEADLEPPNGLHPHPHAENALPILESHQSTLDSQNYRV